MRRYAKYLAIVGTTLRSNLVYGRDVAMRSAFMVIVLFVFTQLWTTTYAVVGEAAIAGFTLRDIVWYLVLTEVVVLSAPRVSLTIDAEVKSGALAYGLTRPYHYVLYHLAAYWGEAVLRVPINAAIGGAVALLTVGPPVVAPPAWPVALLTLALALSLNFAIEALIGLTAFWFEETQPFFWIYQKLTFTIGGLYLPLELFPDWLAGLARALPFAAVTYAPARLFVGFSWEATSGLLALQAGWLAAAGLALAGLYAVAVKGVQVHGG